MLTLPATSSCTVADDLDFRMLHVHDVVVVHGTQRYGLPGFPRHFYQLPYRAWIGEYDSGKASPRTALSMSNLMRI